MKFDKLEEGMVLWSLVRQRMGNTTMSTMGVYRVRVISIDREKRRAMCSWNGNPARVYFVRDIEKLRQDEPILIRSMIGSYRLPTREERKQILAERKAKEANNG